MHRLTSAAIMAGAASALAVASSALAADGLRVATWNISYYAGDRAAQIGTVVYGEWGGRSMSPDLICLQEMTSRNAVNAFVAALNAAPGSPGDWRAAPVLLSGTLNNALVYRTSKLTLDGVVLVSPGSGAPNHPRNVVRHDFRPVGYPEDASIISVFPQHFKAGATPSDFDRRTVEAVIIADHIATLPSGRAVILGADLNTPSGSDDAYRAINGQIPNTGPLFDPIGRVGTWKNNVSYRMIHTQDPTSTAGMDDRYDQLLLSASLLDGRGMDYDGDPATPWDLSRFDDPNHSYRAWGNDGTTYNAPLRVGGNMMVGPTIAQAIKDMADPDGHIPVFLDLDMPGRLGLSADAIDAGVVRFGEAKAIQISVSNAGDVSLWGLGGIAPLRYSFAAGDSLLGVPTGDFEALAGAAPIGHTVMIDGGLYGTLGPRTGVVRVESDDPAAASRDIEVSFEILGCTPADLAVPLGRVDFFDLAEYLNLFLTQQDAADLAEPVGEWNFFDVASFITQLQMGCPG